MSGPLAEPAAPGTGLIYQTDRALPGASHLFLRDFAEYALTNGEKMAIISFVKPIVALESILD